MPILLREALDASASLFDAVKRSSRPADREITAGLKKQRRLSKSELNLVAKTVYAMVRRRRELETIAAGETMAPRAWVLLHLLSGTHIRPQDIPGPDPFLDGVLAMIKAWRSRPAPTDPAERMSLNASLPRWLTQRLIDVYGEETAEPLARSLRRPSSLILRVNTLRCTKEALRARLRAEGVRTSWTKWSPLALVCHKRPRLKNKNTWNKGGFEIQDEGSQLLGMLVDAQPGEVIIDGCAGAGGKTLLLAAAMKGEGELWAIDRYGHRLEPLGERAARAGVRFISRLALEGSKGPEGLAALAGRGDGVLVDAPCSATGALRRDPDAAWRLSLERIAEFQSVQRAILETNAALVKEGGRLVYATCSVLSDENAEVVESFLSEHPEFTLVDAHEVLSRQGVPALSHPEGVPAQMLQLLPSLHGTDGFFGAVMIRRAASFEQDE